jgi:hypothetical protein
LLSQLSSEARTREHIHRTLSPRAVALREDRLPALIRRLERQGLAPRVEFPLPAVESSRRKFDQATLAHLYLAVRLNHQLAEILPSAYRTPIPSCSIWKSNSLRATVTWPRNSPTRPPSVSSTRHCPKSVLMITCPLPPLKLSSSLSTPSKPASRSKSSTTHPTARLSSRRSRDEITTRAIEPHRLEWRGRVPYLIAYCQLDQDERTFRVDRIRECRMTNDE